MNGQQSTFYGCPSSLTRQAHFPCICVTNIPKRMNSFIIFYQVFCLFAMDEILLQYCWMQKILTMSIQKYLSKLKQLELLTQSEVSNLCRTATAILMQQPNVVETTGQQFIIGDIHGQFHDLRNLIDNIIPEMGDKKYVFLGDYVDRGYNSIQTMCLLLCYKCLYPNSIVLIRGNHQTSSLTKIYGFYDEVMKKYGNCEPWKCITQVFQYLPLAAVIQQRILCVHGGLSPNIPFIDNIALIDRVRQIPQTGPMSDLVWSDPDANLTTWAISNRGAGYLFPHQAVKQFMHINDIKTVARAHQLVEQGYIFNFGDESLVTVWSAPNYCYRCGNQASVMKIKEDGTHEFIKFSPSDQTLKHNISYEYVLPYFL